MVIAYYKYFLCINYNSINNCFKGYLNFLNVSRKRSLYLFFYICILRNVAEKHHFYLIMGSINCISFLNYKNNIKVRKKTTYTTYLVI